MKKFFILAWCFWATSPLLAQTSYVPVTRTLYERGHQLQIGGDFFQTLKIKNADGTPATLGPDQSFNRYQLEVGGQYGLTDKLQVGGGARFRHNESTYPDNTGEVSTSTGAGLQSLFAGFSYAFSPAGKLRYALEGVFRYTPYTNKVFTAGSSDSTLILGDDGNEYSAGPAVSYFFQNNNSITLRGGYRRPGIDLSDEFYWQGEGALVWRQIALVAGVDGVTTLNNDPYSGTDRPVYNTGITGLYNSSNREWIAPYIGMNVALGKEWRVELRASQVVDGQSTDIGRSYGLQLFRRVEAPDPKKSRDARFKSYDVEANVTKVSPKKEYVTIDKGLSEDVQKGMSFDFYEFDYVGGNILVARGTVISTKSDSAVVKITQRFDRKKEIKEGLIGRATLK